MIGNDVVDLTDPDAQPGATHERFDARVFAPVERAALAASAAPERLRWYLWACKEAAYKAARKLQHVVFSPSRFVVALDARSRHGWVSHPLGRFHVSIEHEPTYIHAVAFFGVRELAPALGWEGWRGQTSPTPPAPKREQAPALQKGPQLLAAVAAATADSSTAARRLAIRAISAALGEDPTGFRITTRDRVPRFERHGVPAPVDLSLSHHGRFVAFACTLADTGSVGMSRDFHCLAIVNRGEAAMRCIRAVKALRSAEGSDLAALALYTAAERDAPFVRHADRAVALRPAVSEVAAYLDHEGVLEALRRGGADAVWPGWGFVAEDPVFVERLASAGIVFLGPPAAAMRRLGDKIEAKRLAESLGVPVTPWSNGEIGAAAAAAAAQIGYPLMIKAAAGGGGRGIRVVMDSAALADALRAARAEAEAAFGDGRLFLERKVEGGRHIEVQIAADEHGEVCALGCRDCSVQRRHQKLIEETPAPGLSPALRRALEESAIRLARAVGYVGVGTVEFLVAGDSYVFLEVNPRLQVEHTVTEAVTGLDLVQWQIRIARGERLSGLTPEERGWAIEARLCADDPDAGFQPAPGRIARFDPVLAPRIRIDSGVIAGSIIPAAFDSLIAKVIATGETRADARARLASALTDFELVVEGGATNKGFLLEVLADPAFRAGAVDTGWLDRFTAGRAFGDAYAVEGLIAAAILAYQRARAAARLNFFADTTTVMLSRVPRSHGQQITLTYRGQTYRPEVFAIGAWRYRVKLGEQAATVTLRETGSHAARLQIGDRELRVLYDAGAAGVRLEVEGRPLRFGWDSAGVVRASSPAMVVAVDVQAGDRVSAGQALGLLEAMKMEVAFAAPVAGLVTDVRVRRGQQVRAGDVMVVIDAGATAADAAPDVRRVRFPDTADPLAPLFTPTADGGLGAPDLPAAAALPPAARRAAIDAVREEVRRVLLGYDSSPERTECLAGLLEAPIPESASAEFRRQLTEIGAELRAFADGEQLFIASPGASVSGELGPSNGARLRVFVRRLRAGGAGIAPAFLELVRRAMTHYGIASLEPGDALERAVLRLLASQRSSGLRHRLVLAVIRHVTALARAGAEPGADRGLAATLERIGAMRGLVPHGVADAAAEAAYVIFAEPGVEQRAARTTAELDAWISAAEASAAAPPEAVLQDLAEAPRSVFDRVGHWLAAPDARRRAIALEAHLRRLYGPAPPTAHAASSDEAATVVRLTFADGRQVVGGVCAPEYVADVVARLRRASSSSPHPVPLPAGEGTLQAALELFVPVRDGGHAAAIRDAVRDALAATPPARFTLTLVTPDDRHRRHTFVAALDGVGDAQDLHGLHPETAARIGLARLANFELQRCDAPDGLYCFHARSREVRGDERVFVFAELRGRSPDGDDALAERYFPAFEHTFTAATRTLRATLAERDPERRLQWNRITISVAPQVVLDRQALERLARRLAPTTRHLGLEKVVVRLHVRERDALAGAAQAIEIVLADVTGSNLEIQFRPADSQVVLPRSDYERKVAEARRRRLVYPYEVVRLLTSGNGAAGLPVGTFEEYDLDPQAGDPVAISVAGRPYGLNTAAVVFGIISAPTDKVPEGMRRVLVLSDPTMEMGALAAPECDRIIAAIDLAAHHALPVEWVPVSSGARIAMDSGTENLDATARVVRRIVTFTQRCGVIHVIVAGVNVGAQSYWNALATMLMHTRGVLIMTPGASMVLTGRAALEASGGVSGEDELAIGGFERVMGTNGEAQYYAADLADAYRILYEHYRFTYVACGEPGPRRAATADSPTRPLDGPMPEGNGDFRRVAEIFDEATNPERKRPFPMRAVMAALIDRDGGCLERWRAWVGAGTAIVWDAHLGGIPICLIGIESQNVLREGYRPLDGPEAWNGGTLFPLASKKIARALNAASGNRPAVVLATLSGFDGSPESMRKLQLEYGAEIARAVVNFAGPILFLVVSRYHGGAYVVFSQTLNPGVRAAALSGSYASVIGGGPAAAVVFTRAVRARAAADAHVRALQEQVRERPSEAGRERLERALHDATLAAQADIAAEFDAIHTVERARAVGSLAAIIEPADARAFLIDQLRRALGEPPRAVETHLPAELTPTV